MTYSRRDNLDAGTQPTRSGIRIPGTQNRSARTLPSQRPSTWRHSNSSPACTSSCGHLMIRTHTGTGKSATTSTVNGERITA